jgi:hypothetical protein
VIKSTKNYSADGRETSMYILNYENGGFMIVPTDNRSMPILAYSEKGGFPESLDDLPAGLQYWLSETDRIIKEDVKSNKKQESHIKRMWDEYSTINTFSSLRNGNRTMSDCSYEGQSTTDYTIKTLSTVVWGQDSPFNNLMTSAGCTSTTNGRYPASCGQIAVAIVMQYHKRAGAPYNWAAMELSWFHADVAQLIYTLGGNANLNVNPGCSGSSTPVNNIVPTFSNFGYPSPTKTNGNNFYIVKSDIDLNRPVIMGGDRSGGSAHAWVVDGYRQWDNYLCHWDIIDNEYVKIYQSTNAMFQINWGWSSPALNGWYSFGNYTPNGTTNAYNINNVMIHNIRPY